MNIRLISNKLLWCMILILLYFISFEKNKVQTDLKAESPYYDCCNILVTPEHAPFIKTLDKYLYVGYHNGGELSHYAMSLDFQNIENEYRIIALITFYTKEVNKRGRQGVIHIEDTIRDFLVIGKLIDSLKIHDPMRLSCIKGFDDDAYACLERIDVYYKDGDLTNCFYITDTYNKLMDPDYKFYFNIFENSEIFKITLSDIKKKTRYFV